MFPFQRLPPELRNRIDHLLLGNNTIHIDGTSANPTGRYQLVFNTCTSKIDHSTLTDLSIATNESNKSSQAHTIWKPCDSNLIEVTENCCRQPVRLDVQVLRVCRQIHNEAALVPYTKNSFIISGGMRREFLNDLTKRFSFEQRRAIETVAVLESQYWAQYVSKLPQLLPGLKKMWLEYSDLHDLHKVEVMKELVLSKGSCRIKVVMKARRENSWGLSKTERAEKALATVEDEIMPSLSKALAQLNDVDCVVSYLS